MGKRDDQGDKVVYDNPVAGNTREYPKDDAGCTQESTKETIHHQSGNVTDSSGRIVDNVKK